MDNSLQYAWDPVQKDTITTLTFQSEEKALMDKLQNYSNKPNLSRNLFLFLCIPIVVIVLAVLSYNFFPNNFSLLIEAIFFSFIPAVVYYFYVKHLQDEIILCMLCEKNSWIYNPKDDRDRPTVFAQLFPQIFDLGHDRSFSNQIWGVMKHDNEAASFWSGMFQFTIGYGKSSHTYNQCVFAFKLNNPTPADFTLVRPGPFRVFEEKIKTESEDFNKRFKIVSHENDLNIESQIIKILSPSVQTRLIDFSNSYSTDSIAFFGDTMIIALDNEPWQVKYTNFFSQIAIDERDENLIYTCLINMTELPTEIIQFIP